MGFPSDTSPAHLITLDERDVVGEVSRIRQFDPQVVEEILHQLVVEGIERDPG